MIENRSSVAEIPAPKKRVLERDPGAVDHPVLAFFLNYWRTARPLLGVPRYSAFAPRDVRGHLPWVVVAEALPGLDDFRYRLIGTRVAQYFARDATGLSVRAAFADWDAESHDGVLQLFRAPCVAHVPFRYTGPRFQLPNSSKCMPDFDTLYLPYSLDGLQVDRVVNVFTFNHAEIPARTSSLI